MQTRVRLGDVFTLIGGGTPSTNRIEYWGEGTPWFSSADIDAKGKISYRRCVTQIGIKNSTTNIVPANTVIVVTRVGLGKIAILPENMCFSQDMQALLAKDDNFVYSRKFLYYQLVHIMETVKYQGQGTTISGITKKRLADVMLYMPGIEEQQRIVAHIEELFSQLDDAETTLQKTKAQLAQYRQAVLKAAFDAAIQTNAQTMPINQLLCKERKGMTTGPFGTMLNKKEHKTCGVPVLGIENIGEGLFIPGNKIFVTPEKAKELKAFEVKSGDLIISRSGTVGEICEVPDYMEGALLSTNLMRISLNTNIIKPKYFIWLFRSKSVVIDQVKELCKGSTRPFLNQTILKQISFPVPSTQIQEGIIDALEMRLSLCESIEKTINQSFKQVATLRQCMLKSVF